MKHLEFLSSFLTGHAVIDVDHRQLIAFLNQINNCFQEKQGKQAKETCTALMLFMDEHMDREEQILRDAEFPQLVEHIDSHTRLAEKCRKVLAGCNNACLRNQAEDCTTTLTVAIVEHIVRKDLYFKSFLQAEGLANNAD